MGETGTTTLRSSDAISEIERKLSDHLAEHSETDEQKQADLASDQLAKRYSAIFTEARNYTNLIIIAAYASFFTIWNFLRPSLPERAMALVAVLMGASIIGFVIFEIYKIIVLQFSILKANKILASSKNPREFNKLLGDIQKKENRKNVATFVIWALFLIFVVSTGMVAGAILIYNAGALLFRLPHFPQ